MIDIHQDDAMEGCGKGCKEDGVPGAVVATRGDATEKFILS